MGDDLAFRILVFAFVTLGIATRTYFHRKAGSLQDSIRQQREGPVIVVAGILMVIWFLAIGIFLISPQLTGWSKLRLPSWLRWAGVALSIIGTPFYMWIHHVLGKSFSGVLYIQEDHVLVQDGPYRWIRHPMYTAYMVGHLGYFFMTADWLIGSTGLLTITLMMVFRVPREEAALLEKFGDTYRDYARLTGRFLPKLGRTNQSSK